MNFMRTFFLNAKCAGINIIANYSYQYLITK